MTKKQLRRAAYWLRVYAVALRDSYRCGRELWWAADAKDSEQVADAKAVYDEMMALARDLYATARNK